LALCRYCLDFSFPVAVSDQPASFEVRRDS
jgi:hypothetical protein